MHTKMLLEITLHTKGLVTYMTWKWALTCMNKKMALQTTMLTKGFLTHITLIRTFPSMYPLMLLEITSLTKDFLTHITWVSMFVSIYSVMFTKWIFINFRTLTSALTFLQVNIILMQFTSMNTPQISINFQCFTCLHGLKKGDANLCAMKLLTDILEFTSTQSKCLHHMTVKHKNTVL